MGQTGVPSHDPASSHSAATELGLGPIRLQCISAAELSAQGAVCVDRAVALPETAAQFLCFVAVGVSGVSAEASSGPPGMPAIEVEWYGCSRELSHLTLRAHETRFCRCSRTALPQIATVAARVVVATDVMA